MMPEMMTIATAAYFLGVAAVIISGIILKKTKPFSGDPAPFVMELPAYHPPVIKNTLRVTGERGWSFIKRAGSVIFVASIIIWVLNSLSFDGGFHYITAEAGGRSILELIGEPIAFIFKPLGFGSWQTAVATVLGLVAKEEVVGVFGALAGMEEALAGGELAAQVAMGAQFFTSALAGFCFMIFNLLCAPCFAAMGAIRREMNDWRWTAFAIGYMCVFAYAVTLIVYQIGAWFIGGGSIAGTVIAGILLILLGYLLFRPNPNAKKIKAV
jgi:ferrous iron transport protein B